MIITMQFLQRGINKAPSQEIVRAGKNGRGGLFYVIDNKDLFDGVTNLIKGDAAPTKAARNGPSSKASCFSPLT